MIEKLSTKVFSEEFKNKTERVFVTLSILSFVIHLLNIFKICERFKFFRR